MLIGKSVKEIIVFGSILSAILLILSFLPSVCAYNSQNINDKKIQELREKSRIIKNIGLNELNENIYENRRDMSMMNVFFEILGLLFILSLYVLMGIIILIKMVFST